MRATKVGYLAEAAHENPPSAGGSAVRGSGWEEATGSHPVQRDVTPPFAIVCLAQSTIPCNHGRVKPLERVLGWGTHRVGEFAGLGIRLLLLDERLDEVKGKSHSGSSPPREEAREEAVHLAIFAVNHGAEEVLVVAIRGEHSHVDREAPAQANPPRVKRKALPRRKGERAITAQQ
jgi:hypothetical protein